MADYGPLVTKAHLDKVKAYVGLGIKESAKLYSSATPSFYMGGPSITRTAFLDGKKARP
jgi:hypothetical protein